jgi:hypothetical protein
MSSRGEVLSEEISAGVNSPQAVVEADWGGMRSNMSFFLEILGSLCLDMLDGIFLDWIWRFAWTYEALHGALEFAFLAGYELQAATRA